MPDDVKSREQLEKEWWDHWFALDYSWDGLAEKPWQGWQVVGEVVCEKELGLQYGAPARDPSEPTILRKGHRRDATLQDYWRADPTTGRLRSDHEIVPELVRAPNQLTFHYCHLPLRYKDGRPTDKSNLPSSQVDSIIDARLRAARANKIDFHSYTDAPADPDYRAQLDGCVWSNSDCLARAEAPIYARYLKGYFVRSLIVSDAQFGSGCDFTGALFRGWTFFGKPQFLGRVSFQRCTFLSDVDFHEPMLHDSADFNFQFFVDGPVGIRPHFLATWTSSEQSIRAWPISGVLPFTRKHGLGTPFFA